LMVIYTAISLSVIAEPMVKFTHLSLKYSLARLASASSGT
jgi:hypothetical protein